MSDFNNLLLIPPGNLIYYIVLVFVSAGTLMFAFLQWRASEFPQARRAVVGLGILILAQIGIFAIGGLSWQQIIDPKTILPPMDRAFLMFGIVWITWLYAFPEPNRVADAVVTILSLFVLTALGLSLLTWQPQVAEFSYNQTLDDQLWQIGSVILALFGIGVILIRRPDGMWYGILLLFIGLIGHLSQLLLQTEGDYSGIIRLAYISAYPILFTLPLRFSTAPSVESPVTVKPTTLKQDTIGRVERRRYSTDPKTFHALLAVAAENNPTKMSQALTRAIAKPCWRICAS